MDNKDEKILEYIKRNIYYYGDDCDDDDNQCMYKSVWDKWCSLFQSNIYSVMGKDSYIVHLRCDKCKELF